MKFSLAHLTLLPVSPPEMTYIAARAGYDYVSFRIIPLGLLGEKTFAIYEDRELFRKTKTALRETGLGVLDVELARIADNVDVKRYVPGMEAAAELGAKHMTSSIWTSDRQFALEAFMELCDLAKPFGLTMDIEFVTWAELTGVNDTAAFLRDAGRDNCGILVDTLHFHRSRCALEDLDSLPDSWFHYVHICDAPANIPETTEGLIHAGRAERLYVGEGGINIAEILGRLPEMPCAIELPHALRADELGFAEHAFRCLETARAYFDVNPVSPRK
jgi:Sugar phosphate isomerases/epimerases